MSQQNAENVEASSPLKRLVIFLYSPFYKMVGELTKPSNAELCENDDWWVECDYDDLPNNPWGENVHPYHYRYTYQKLSQNCFGKWQKEKQWLGRNYDLDYYRQCKKAYGI